MPRPRSRTRAAKVKPVTVAQRLGDAPPSGTYRYRGKGRPAGADTYALEGMQHRYDGRCHPDCPNVR